MTRENVELIDIITPHTTLSRTRGEISVCVVADVAIMIVDSAGVGMIPMILWSGHRTPRNSPRII